MVREKNAKGGRASRTGGAAGHAREAVAEPGAAAREERGGGLPEPTKATYEFDPRATEAEREDLRRAAEILGGKGATIRDMLALAGVPDDEHATVSSYYYGQDRKLDAIAIHLDSDRMELSRVIGRDEKGDRIINNNLFVVKSRTNANQDYNGYYTWPRFGYDGKLSGAVKKSLPAGLKGSKTVLDLMATRNGRAWWKEHGHAMELTFDLRPGSRSRKVLSNYIRERRAKGTLSSSLGLKVFIRQVRNASARKFRTIHTEAAGEGPRAIDPN